ncbi:putative F-box protein At5g44220 [Cornus florida]|uniref:putative F-box protein At5g44220 n=1 Tax=Cornus florida TaxID=4283 RepID=UPI0028A0FC3E|nr:putative F-box protein At5g44220 [Cornus florida]
MESVHHQCIDKHQASASASTMGKERKFDCFSVPPDIFVKILEQLPVKSLLKFRCVSKLWCSIIDIAFVNWHHASSGTSILLVSKRYDGCRLLDSAEPEGDIVHHILYLPFSALESDTKYHCVNGLIHTDGYIWNLRMRERISIPPMTLSFLMEDSEPFKLKIYHFLGFDPSTMEYKVLSRCSTTIHNGVKGKNRN